MIRSAVRRLAAVVICVLTIPLAASASSIFFDLDRIDDFVFPSDEFAVFIEIEIDAPNVMEVTVTMGTMEVPMEVTFDGLWENANDEVFPSLLALKTAVNGTWEIVITGGADASTSTFSVDANGLSDADFPATATGLLPADGATGVSADTLLSWTAILSQFVVSVFAGDDFGEQENDNLFGTLTTNASSWQPPLALPTGMVEWGVFYARDPTSTANLVGSVTVNSGSIDWAPHELIVATGVTWPANTPFMVLGSETIVEIAVPEPAELLQSGVALATLGLLVCLRSRRSNFAGAA